MVKIEVLSPIHIGSGQEILPIEYIIEGNNFYRIDMEKLFLDKAFNRDKFLRFVEIATKEEKIPYLGNFDGKFIENNQKYRLGISEKINEAHPPRIKEFIKTSNKFYIPGSSIKGVVLSALYWHVLKESGNSDSGINDMVRACLAKDFRVLQELQNIKKYKQFIVMKWNINAPSG